MLILVLNLILMLGAVALNTKGVSAGRLTLTILNSIYAVLIGPLLFRGLRILKPNEAMVLTFFGTYHGTLRGPGFFFVNPFAVSALQPETELTTGAAQGEGKPTGKSGSVPSAGSVAVRRPVRRVSLKIMTLSNDKQKVNDVLGNLIIIGIVVVWKVMNTVRAVFNVDNYMEYLFIRCDSALRNIVRLYPSDASEDEGEKSLQGSSQEIAECPRAEIQAKVDIAGLDIIEARITHLSYAPEIAAVMLQG